VITAEATDPFGATRIDSVTITVANTPPTAKITFPPTGSNYYTSQNVNLRGSAFDPDESIPEANLSWNSSISGFLGTGSNLLVSLSAGLHTIALTATDSLGETGQATITVNVQACTGYPTAQILSPANNTVVGLGKTVSFQGRGTDPEDGQLTGSSLQWISDVDGPLGTGESLSSIVLSGKKCQPILHTITLEVTDKDLHKAIDSIVVVVLDLC
jgi:hypothetical protein